MLKNKTAFKIPKVVPFENTPYYGGHAGAPLFSHDALSGCLCGRPDRPAGRAAPKKLSYGYTAFSQGCLRPWKSAPAAPPRSAPGDLGAIVAIVVRTGQTRSRGARRYFWDRGAVPEFRAIRIPVGIILC